MCDRKAKEQYEGRWLCGTHLNAAKRGPKGHRMDAKTLRYHLREACKQIDEFRKRCDPDERQVLVTPTEMLGADSFSEEARWYDV